MGSKTLSKVANVGTFGLVGGSALNAANKNKQPQPTQQIPPLVARGPISPPPAQPVWTQPVAREPVGPAQPFGSSASGAGGAPPFPFLPPSWAGWRR